MADKKSKLKKAVHAADRNTTDLCDTGVRQLIGCLIVDAFNHIEFPPTSDDTEFWLHGGFEAFAKAAGYINLRSIKKQAILKMAGEPCHEPILDMSRLFNADQNT